jgi:thioredoxin 1
VREVTDETFERDVLAAPGPVVVGFGAPWCKPCVHVDAVLEQLEREQPGIAFVKLDVDANPAAATRFGVLSIPAAILFEGGEARATVLGVQKRGGYERAWAGWLRAG